MATLFPFEIHDREGLATFVKDVLGDVESALEPFGAERAAFQVDGIWVGTGGAVTAMAGEGFHDIDLVIMWEATVRGRYGREASLTDSGRHGGGGLYGLCQRPFGDGRRGWGRRVVIDCFGVCGRHLGGGR